MICFLIIVDRWCWWVVAYGQYTGCAMSWDPDPNWEARHRACNSLPELLLTCWRYFCCQVGAGEEVCKERRKELEITDCFASTWKEDAAIPRVWTTTAWWLTVQAPPLGWCILILLKDAEIFPVALWLPKFLNTCYNREGIWLHSTTVTCLWNDLWNICHFQDCRFQRNFWVWKSPVV